MDTPAPDEGEPAAPLSFSRYPLLFLSLFLFTACTHPDPPDQGTAAGESGKNIGKAVPIQAPVAQAPRKKKKKIYLTFDDGPNRGTQNVLNIVQEENIPATFFIVGQHVFASPAQARTWDSLLNAHHIELCNHSYTHALNNRYETFYKHPDTVVRDMERTREKLLPGTMIVRAPGRNSWRIDSLHFTDIKKSKAALDSLQTAGFIVMGWDLEWHYDHKTMEVKNSADELLNQVDSLFKKGKTKVPDNLIILAHDQVYAKTADSFQLRQFIQKLKQKDEYELELASNYPGVRKDSAKPK